ncbi:MAG: histidinol dehydrogenase, partial [Candidatus Hydrothermarchaeales archaeon]
MIFKEIHGLTREEKGQILNRGGGVDPELVKEIIDEVRRRGDGALKEYTERFDGASLDSLRVGDEEFEEAMKGAGQEVVERIKEAHQNILAFHKRQMEEGWWYEESGRRLGQVVRPVEKVGCYIPGGKAFYPSSVLMAVTPARVAGVDKIVCTTPPRSDGKVNEYTLAACVIAGVDEVYKVGGAQAIAALAYGTESIPKVDMVVGPGNVYVTAAKKAVFGDVGIDMLAGPSEVLIIADSSANAAHVVYDVLAQAEHDSNAACLLVTTSKKLAERVKEALEGLGDKAPEGLKNTAILIAKNLEEAVEFA